jgi:glutathione synthase/RimK-type ligase-like ATP-grasp enzyme
VIAIHNNEDNYALRWMQYCDEHHIEYLRANIYDSNIIEYLKQNHVKVLLAHVSNIDYKTALVARSIISSIELSGIKIFPNRNAIWHYDDKIAQKFIFESYEIPHARMHVFFEAKQAEEWLNVANFPLVFKLRGGAGSSNVSLLRNKSDAKRLIKKMFHSGIKPIRSIVNDFSTKLTIHKRKRDFLRTLLRLPKTFTYIKLLNKRMPRQNGYFLVQEYLPGNTFDTRVVIVGKKAFTFRRFNRENDFRASGSKNIDLNQENVDKRAITLAFEAAKKIGSYSMAFDILFNADNNPVIIEMSYTCPVETIDQLEGFWDASLNFHKGKTRLEDAIIEFVME